MLHGFTASAAGNWLASGWIAALTQAGRRVLAIDARGHGDSDKLYNSDYYPSNVMMQDSVALLRQMGFSRADFVGYSMGARMAAFVAIHYPVLVRRLVLGGMGINLKNGIGGSKGIAEALQASHVKDIKSRQARRFRRLAEMGNNDLRALACCILSARQKITAKKLQNIYAKTLILVGSDDNTGGNPQLLAPYIDNSVAIEVADCNHFNSLTNAQFRQIAINFIVHGEATFNSRAG